MTGLQVGMSNVAGVLAERGNDASSSRRRARGGKGSRARRLENYQHTKAAANAQGSVAAWALLVQGALRQHRANQRDNAREAWARACRARAKLRAAAWQAWTCRSLETDGLDVCVQGVHVFDTGQALAPLSRRDMWILTRAARLMLEIMMKQFARDPSFSDESLDPTSWRFCRHPLDWLRVSSRAGPHWIHTHRALDRAEQSTSDEDDCDEYPSEQDNRRSEY